MQKKILSVYLGQEVIPRFKNRRLAIYANILQQFNVMQINNAHQIGTFWSHILQNPVVKNAIDQEK